MIIVEGSSTRELEKHSCMRICTVTRAGIATRSRDASVNDEAKSQDPRSKLQQCTPDIRGSCEDFQTALGTDDVCFPHDERCDVSSSFHVVLSTIDVYSRMKDV